MLNRLIAALSSSVLVFVEAIIRKSRSSGVSQRQFKRYNYKHFWFGHIVGDFWRSLRGEGLTPGTEAPDFELESTEGKLVRLSALRGQPVYLRFGSVT